MIFPPHSFAFAELQTPAIDAAARFYGELFGWTLEPIADNYWMFRLGSQKVVAARRADDHFWLPSLKVADVDTTLVRLPPSWSIASPAVEVPGVSRACVVRDPEGARLQLWEPRGVEGTEVETGPGSLWWVELATHDKAASERAYASLFDWGLTHTGKFENGKHGYTLFKIGDRSVAGAFQPEPEWEMTPVWQVYFEVANFDATAAQACALGGEQGFWRDVPHAGRIGAIVDPRGATFLAAEPNQN